MSLAAAAGLATASAATTSGTDTCGYPNSSGGASATVFNESTLTRWVEVFGSGSSGRVGVFSNDENGVLLGIGATPNSGVAHVSSPSLGSLSAKDPSGRPYYPSLFITNITSNSSSTAGDWQHGGTGTTFVSDAYGTWVTGSFVNGQYQRNALPSKNNWDLGAGADTPSPGFSALGNEGYGSEFTWNLGALGLQAGNTYRLQVMTHDGDQNRSGGDVGELCTNLTIPGPPVTPAVTVAKTNNASGTGFAKTSTAPQAGAAVPFQLVVTNTSNESETVTSVSDTWPGSSIQPDCRTSSGTALLGSTLAAGASVTCTFTLNGYAPPAGQSVVDTVAVTVTDANHQTASDTSSSTVNTAPVVTQTISGSVLLCDANGNRTSVPVNGGTIHVLSGNTVVLSANDQLGATAIPAGTYTMAGTAPSGYNFVACGLSGVTISSPPTTASQSVTVPAGSSGTGVFYVSPVVVTNQTISGSILLCDANGNRTTTPVNGGTLQVLSGSSVLLTANDQLSPTSIAPGTYTLAGGAPSGYHFVDCGLTGVTIATPPMTATQSVTVPAGSSGSGVFYVKPTPVSQTISGSILLCDANGNRTSVPVNGGTLQVLSGSSLILSANDQLSPTQVPAGTYTMAGGAPSGYRFVSCGLSGVTISSPPTTASQSVTVPAGSSGSGVFYVSPVVVNQTISGSILLCDANGNRTSVPVNGGTLQVLSGSTLIASANDQLSPISVPAGTYTMAGGAPSGYRFVPCGLSGVTISSPPTTATQSVTVPVGSTGSGVFYVAPVVVNQTISGSILLCDALGNRTSVPVNGGTLQVLSGSTLIVSANDQLSPTSVQAGTYTMAGGAPSGYQFVSCGLSGVTISTPPNTATQSVTVPAGQNAAGVFYVSRIVVGNQTISGSILLCDPSGAPTTTPVNGGILQVLSGSSVILSTSNQLPPASVQAGTYTMAGGAPSGYQFVPCGATGVTIASPPVTATQTVVVPSGSSGSGVFYVRPVVVNQTISGSILLCDANGNQTTTPVNGGALQVMAGNTLYASATDQLSPAAVPAGVYTMAAQAPPGYMFVACGGTGVNITSPPTGANQTVTVPSGQNVIGVFYVNQVPLVAVIDKTNNAAGTGYGKVELASTPGQAVPFRAVITNNSVVPVVITSLTDAWPGQVPFSPACAQAVVGAVLAANGGSVTCDFTLSNYAPPAGQWLVDTVTATMSQLDVSSNSTISSNSTTVANTSTVGTTAVLGEQLSPPTTAGQITTVAPSVTPSVSPSVQATAPLAFTGAPSRLWEVLEVGLALMSLGCFVLWLTRPREPLPLTGRL